MSPPAQARRETLPTFLQDLHYSVQITHSLTLHVQSSTDDGDGALMTQEEARKGDAPEPHISCESSCAGDCWEKNIIMTSDDENNPVANECDGQTQYSVVQRN